MHDRHREEKIYRSMCRRILVNFCNRCITVYIAKPQRTQQGKASDVVVQKQN